MKRRRWTRSNTGGLVTAGNGPADWGGVWRTGKTWAGNAIAHMPLKNDYPTRAAAKLAVERWLARHK